MKTYIGKIMITLCAAILLTGLRYITSKGYTPELVSDSGIEYPISLSTGLDRNGRDVFPDKKFLQYINEEVFRTGKYSGNKFDLDDDGYLSKEECETVRILSIAGRMDITSAAGVEAFPKLREFYCNGTGIRELDLSHNPRLQILACSNSPVETLDICSCTILRELKAAGCALSHIDLASNGAMALLTCLEQKRTAGGYYEDGKYMVDLNDLDLQIDLSKISDVKIDGAAGDGINSGYDSSAGIVYCSDEIQTVSYTYYFNFSGAANASMDSQMNVTLSIVNGYREGFQTDGGSKVLAEYYNGVRDCAPVEPVREGYSFTGWYRDKDRTEPYHFNQILDRNIELYAGWEKKSYRVIYRAEGTSLDGKERRERAEWRSAGLIPVGQEIPVRTGYTLSGWKTETGRVITSANASAIQYKDAALNSERDYTILEAIWSEKTYKLRLDVSLPEPLKNEREDMPSLGDRSQYTWNSSNILYDLPEPSLCGYYLTGWYTARTGGTKVTDQTTYGGIHSSQFTEDDSRLIPVLYARFAKRKYTIRYEERGGSRVADRQNVVWGSSDLLPGQKTKKKGYKLAGWKYHNGKVTKKTKLNDARDGFSDYITLTAMWSKVSERKGKIFKRYGCVYRIAKSGEKKNQVTLIRITRKKITIRNKVFLNGRFFELKGIKKKVLKNAKRIRIKTTRRLSRKLTKMVRRAGAKKRTMKKVFIKK